MVEVPEKPIYGAWIPSQSSGPWNKLGFVSKGKGPAEPQPHFLKIAQESTQALTPKNTKKHTPAQHMNPPEENQEEYLLIYFST